LHKLSNLKLSNKLWQLVLRLRLRPTGEKMETSTISGLNECLVCLGKGWVTVQAEPRIVETCRDCCGGNLDGLE
jgi:hypothetical protein